MNQKRVATNPKGVDLRYFKIKEVFMEWDRQGKLAFVPDVVRKVAYRIIARQFDQLAVDAMIDFFTATEDIKSYDELLAFLERNEAATDWFFTPHAYAIYRAKLAKAEQKTHERHYG